MYTYQLLEHLLKPSLAISSSNSVGPLWKLHLLLVGGSEMHTSTQLVFLGGGGVREGCPGLGLHVHVYIVHVHVCTCSYGL